MEDRHAIRFVKNDEGGFEFAYFGIFDGHGGGEASKYARDYLLDEITKYDCFWSDNDEDILYAIKSAFLDTHYGMWKELEKWPKTASGLPSTAGTTASICIIKNSKLYIGHVGDSAIVLGYNDSKLEKIVRPKAKMLTKEHKPDDPTEKKRIEGSGGQVVAKSGVQRVVWNRPRTTHKGPVRRSTPIDKIPFLAVARSLGDLWSYNYLKEEFVVSPEPDVSVHKLDPTTDKCLVIGSDGLWNMMTAEETVNMVVDMEYQFEHMVINDPSVPVSYWINPAERLVQTALNKWRMRLMKADNTSAIVVLIDPLGPRKLSILKKKREDRIKQLAEAKIKDNKAATDLLIANETLNHSPKKTFGPVHKSQKPQPSVSIPKPETSNLGQVQLFYHDPITSMSMSVNKVGEKSPLSSPMLKFTDNLDDSVQLRKEAMSPAVLSNNLHVKSPKLSPHSNRTPSSAPVRLRTSPLQTSSSENVCRSGMSTRSSPLKAPVMQTNTDNVKHSSVPIMFTGCQNVQKAKKDCDNANKVLTEPKTCSKSGVNTTIPKFSQANSHGTENVKTVCKVKDVENIFSSDVKLGLRNFSVTKHQLTNKTNKNQNNTCLESLRGAKKIHSTKSLSTRISLRLRRIRQKTKRGKVPTTVAENKSFVAKAGIKRKMDSPHGSPPPHSAKKVKHA